MRILSTLGFIVLMLFPNLGLSKKSIPSGRSPSSEDVNSVLLNDLKKAEDFIKSHNTAAGCEAYAKLLNYETLPLNEFIKLRIWEHCDPAKYSLSDFTEYWILPSAEQINFINLNKKKSFIEAADFLIEKVNQWQISDREKSDLILSIINQNITQKTKNKLQEALANLSPRFIGHPKSKDFFKVADDFRLNRKFTEARQYYQKIVTSPQFSKLEKLKAYKWITKTYKLEKQTLLNEFLKSSDKWAHFLDSEIKQKNPIKLYIKNYHDANIENVRAIWTETNQEQAIKALDKFQKMIQGKYTLHEVYRLKAKMAQENKNYEESEKWLTLAKAEVFRSNEEKERIYWSLIWILKKESKWSESNAVIEELLNETWVTPSARSKYQFWMAQNLLQLNQTEAANKLFKKIATENAYTFYGLLAHRQLKLAITKPNVYSNSYKNIRKFFESEKLYLQFIYLVELSESELAKTLIRKKFSNLISVDKASLDLLELFATAGDYLKLYQVFALLPLEEQDDITKNRFHFLFPTPFLSDVKKAETEIHIPAALTYSIMRQESAFDVKARSHADAFGLMQLLPEIARKTASELKWKTMPEPEDLYRPEIIIPLGAAHLKDLLNKQNNQFIRAVASYNSSPQAFQNWMKTRFNGNVLEFIEEIPYEETQDYIKLISRNFIYYNLVIGKNNEIMFPEEILNLSL